MPRFCYREAQGDTAYCSSSEESSDLNYSGEENDEESALMDDQQFAVQNQSRKYSIGSTRFTLSEEESMAQYKRRWGYTSDFDKRVVNERDQRDPRWIQQTYPPIHTYLDAKTAPSDALLRLSLAASSSYMEKRDDVDHTMDRLSQLLQAVAIVEAPPALPAPPKFLRIQQQQQQRDQHEITAAKQRFDREHAEAAEALRLLLKSNQDRADKILQAEERLIAEADRERRAKEEKEAG